MRFDWWTLALQTVNFAVLVWLLHRLLYKPVLRAIDARRVELDAQRAEAARVEGEVKTRLAAIDAERAKITVERGAALKAAAAQGEQAVAARHAQAERDAAALLSETRNILAKERSQALAEARKVAIELGTEIAQRLLAEVPVELRAEAWLTRVEQHLTDLSESERAELAMGLNEGTLRVVTANSLPDAVMSGSRDRLRRAFGQNISITFEVDEALVAGAELYFPTAILHLSWRSVLAIMGAEIDSHGNAR